MKHVRIWGIAAVILALGAGAMAALGEFGIHYWRLILLSLPFIVIGGCFGYGRDVFFRAASIVSFLAYGLWIYTYVTTPNESMGDLALVAAYIFIAGLLVVLSIVLLLLYGVVLIVKRKRRT